MRPVRFTMFISLWSILVYSPIARWSWSTGGWSQARGSLDFAGGTPVHIAAGSTVAAMALFNFMEVHGVQRSFCFLKGELVDRIGDSIPWAIFAIFMDCFGVDIVKLKDENKPDIPIRAGDPFNVNQAILGTGLIWFGWFGFNSGSALGASERALSACLATHVAACAGGATTLLLHWSVKAWKRPGHENDVHNEEYRRITGIHFCDGVIAGLVAITPGSGYVSIYHFPC
jgi:ammonium transporter, Amt family